MKIEDGDGDGDGVKDVDGPAYLADGAGVGGEFVCTNRKKNHARA